MKINDMPSPSHGNLSSRWFAVVLLPVLMALLLALYTKDDDSIQSHSSEYIPRTLLTDNDIDDCYQTLLSTFLGDSSIVNTYNPFDESNNILYIQLHRNGESDPCGNVSTQTLLQDFKMLLKSFSVCPNFDDKYEMESFVTRYLHDTFTGTSANHCTSVEPNRSPALGFLGFCDMGKDKTPILLDHHQLVPVSLQAEDATSEDHLFLPCHFHNQHGKRVQSFSDLAQLVWSALASVNNECSAQDSSDCVQNASRPTAELHLTAVPAGRVFLFAPSHVGQIIDLPHVVGADPNKSVYLQVLSVVPRVFELVNFFSRDDSNDLLQVASNETRPAYKIQRSTTGAVAKEVNNYRTSESGFDTHSPTAQKLKRRCFDILGFDKYIEGHSDGLQMLRYNRSTAYLTHMDYLEFHDGLPYDYDSSGVGGNRFATVLLYMTDLGERDGGETAFTEAWPIGQAPEDSISLQHAISRLRESGDAVIFERGSWEETLVARCRSHLSIRPRAGRSILFYSQHPNGRPDTLSKHSGCPVLTSTPKYAANLWVWNHVRPGFEGGPSNPRYRG